MRLWRAERAGFGYITGFVKIGTGGDENQGSYFIWPKYGMVGTFHGVLIHLRPAVDMIRRTAIDVDNRNIMIILHVTSYSYLKYVQALNKQ